LAIDRDIADARAQAAIDARVCHALQRLGLDIRPLLPVPKNKERKARAIGDGGRGAD
jgi:hypothetical protein